MFPGRPPERPAALREVVVEGASLPPERVAASRLVVDTTSSHASGQRGGLALDQRIAEASKVCVDVQRFVGPSGFSQAAPQPYKGPCPHRRRVRLRERAVDWDSRRWIRPGKLRGLACAEHVAWSRSLVGDGWVEDQSIRRVSLERTGVGGDRHDVIARRAAIAPREAALEAVELSVEETRDAVCRDLEALLCTGALDDPFLIEQAPAEPTQSGRGSQGARQVERQQAARRPEPVEPGHMAVCVSR